MKFGQNKWATIIISVLATLFLVIPLLLDSYNHHVQDSTFTQTHSQVISCRSEVVLKEISVSNNFRALPVQLERQLDQVCGQLPHYDSFTWTSENRLLALYNWVVQRVPLIPL